MEDIDELMDDDQFENEKLLDSQELNNQDDYQQDDISDGELVASLLRSKGIEDPSKITFVGDDNQLETKDWDSLNGEEKFNILNSHEDDSPERDLDDSEIALVNAMRSSKLTPQEYLEYISRQSIDNYIQNTSTPTYKVDDYSNEELFVMDLISKAPDLTEDEAIEALETAKENESLFEKQMRAVRNEYRNAENQSIQYQNMQRAQLAQAQYAQYSNNMENAIIRFRDSKLGQDFNLGVEDMQDMHTFLTGRDNAGTPWLSKALNNPDTLAEMSFYLLYGDQLIDDMNDYYRNAITEARKRGYQQGLEDAQKGKMQSVAYRPKGQKAANYDDLDNF